MTIKSMMNDTRKWIRIDEWYKKMNDDGWMIH